ncbi:hypothetical protein ACQU0X_23090 [Pseudovibrio ascidiaceicola]|uniref:hypothetical protein n=1 Tax=Pseudovibrio ascidiaceicola TaxID=285279 RepID=UPI003D35F865
MTISEDATVSAVWSGRAGLFFNRFWRFKIGVGSGETAAAAGTFDTSTAEFRDNTATLVFNHSGETGAYQFDADLSNSG